MEATVKVATEVPEPGAAMGFVAKATVTPVGAPEAVNVMVLLNPPETDVVMVEVPLLPCVTESEEGEAETVNEGVCVDEPVRAAMSPALGLPQPVTRSYPVTAE